MTWRHGLIAALLVIAAVTSSRAQALPPPAKPTPAWDTQVLVNEAHKLTSDDVPRMRARAEMGDARSQVLLGLAYEMGAADLMPQPTEALSWFLKAAEQGVTWAQVWAADFYFTGSPGVPRDMYKALELYETAANRGEPRAAFFVGQMYFFGDGVSLNHHEAATWFRKGVAADPDVVNRMVALADVTCDSTFCVSLRQVVGAVMIGLAERFTGEWNEATHEWEATLELPDSDRCGFTSSDRTDMGNVQNFFCDSELIDDNARGASLAQQLADDVQKALPAVFKRTEGTTPRQGPATFFSADGYPHIRVTFNITPGDAPRRVTLLVGP